MATLRELKGKVKCTACGRTVDLNNCRCCDQFFGVVITGEGDINVACEYEDNETELVGHSANNG